MIFYVNHCIQHNGNLLTKIWMHCAACWQYVVQFMQTMSNAHAVCTSFQTALLSNSHASNDNYTWCTAQMCNSPSCTIWTPCSLKASLLPYIHANNRLLDQYMNIMCRLHLVHCPNGHFFEQFIHPMTEVPDCYLIVMQTTLAMLCVGNRQVYSLSYRWPNDVRWDKHAK